MQGVSVAHVDCTVDENKNRALCDGEGVNGFPTLNIYKDGVKVDFLYKSFLFNARIMLG